MFYAFNTYDHWTSESNAKEDAVSLVSEEIARRRKVILLIENEIETLQTLWHDTHISERYGQSLRCKTREFIDKLQFQIKQIEESLTAEKWQIWESSERLDQPLSRILGVLSLMVRLSKYDGMGNRCLKHETWQQRCREPGGYLAEEG